MVEFLETQIQIAVAKAMAAKAMDDAMNYDYYSGVVDGLKMALNQVQGKEN